MEKYDLIFVSPHLDDAVLSCGGWMAQKCREGEKVLVVTVFSQIDANNASTKAKQYLEECGYEDMKKFHEARVSEDTKALKVLGVDGMYLDLVEADYRNSEEVSMDSVGVVVEDKLKKGGIIVVPAAIGGHSDHVIVNEWGKKRFSDCKILFWEDYPYLMYGLGNKRKALGEYALEKRIDVGVVIEIKERAIRCYQSQLKPLFRYKKMYLSGFENYYSLGRDKGNKIHFLTDELEGGAKVANDEIISYLSGRYKNSLRLFEQAAPLLSGKLTRIRLLVWSVVNFAKYLQIEVKPEDMVLTSSPNTLIAARILGKKIKKLVFWVNADRGLPIPKFGTTKWLFWWVYRLVDKLSIGRAKVIIVPSECARASIINRYGRGVAKKIKVVKLGVDREVFRKIPIDKKRGKVMYCGRLDEIKGVEKIVKAVEMAKGANLTLVTPPTSLKEIVKNYNESLCVINVSENESFCLVMLEALSCGTLFIGRPTGEIGEVLGQIDRNLLLEKGDIPEIVDKIEYVLGMDENKRVELLAKAQEIIRRYSWDKTGQEIFSILEN